VQREGLDQLNDLIGIRTRDLPACNIVPQPTTLPRAPRVLVGSRMFYSPLRPDRFWGPLNLLSIGYRGLFPGGVKWPGREADQSSTSAEVKKMWI
jgi:hypothetical protein